MPMVPHYWMSAHRGSAAKASGAPTPYAFILMHAETALHTNDPAAVATRSHQLIMLAQQVLAGSVAVSAQQADRG
jgi:hypothetical protein